MRWHLFEFNDQPWLPTVWRNALTAYLYAAYRSTPFGSMFARQVAALLGATGSNRIVDLCSGAGGPIAIVEVLGHVGGAASGGGRDRLGIHLQTLSPPADR